MLPRHHEQLPDHAGPLPDVLLDQLGAGDPDEGAVRVVGDCTCQQSLSGPRGAVEQHAFRLGDAQGVEELRVLDGELDDLLDLLREGLKEKKKRREVEVSLFVFVRSLLPLSLSLFLFRKTSITLFLP